MDLAITRRFGTAAALISVLAFFATVAQAADFDDDPRRIVTQDEGQSHTRVASILSYLSVQRAIDRDGVHLNEDFSWDRTIVPVI